MSIYKFAPKPVIDALSPLAKNIIESRINNDKLQTYVSIGYNLRIRGLKPSILYVKYTNLTFNDIIESMYVVDAEEEQCRWVNKIIDRINSTSKIELFINAMTEASWCTWEDNFLEGQNIIPLKHLHGYRDSAKNTFLHCISYACTNKYPFDLDEIENQFQACNFSNNPDMFELNDLGETPLKILMSNENLIPFVESILLRMNPSSRFFALPFSCWHNSWGKLLNTIVESDLQHLIRSTKYMNGFLSVFMFLTYNSEDALIELFRAGYNLQSNHIFLDKISVLQKDIISSTIRFVPTWYNLSHWMNLIYENSSVEKYFKKIQKYLIVRNNLIKEKIIMISNASDWQDD